MNQHNGGSNWQADTIVANSGRANSSVTIQNVYVHDVNGQAGSQEGDVEHGDAIQSWIGPSVLRVAYLTVNTRYQGILAQPRQTGTPPTLGQWEFRHIDVVRPTAAGWQLYHLNTTVPMVVEDSWAHAPNESNQSGDVMTDNFKGKVTVGQPPARMVDPAKVGIGYVSPGYR